MKTFALVLFFTAVSVSAAGSRIVQRSMGGDLVVSDAPNGATLRTMGGNIQVTNSRGSVVAKTMGGDITIRNVDGAVDAGTMGGNVKVDVAGNGAIEITSMGGHIELTLPAAFSGNFDVEMEESDDERAGEIVSDFPLKIRQTTRSRWFRPDTRVHSGTGVTGSGTHRVKITTIGGNVTIRKK
jgi:DUF4097 and DUF4098 domain-containing protein YvlB